MIRDRCKTSEVFFLGFPKVFFYFHVTMYIQKQYDLLQIYMGNWTILALILKQLLGLEVGMRFKAWHNKSNIIHCVVKIYQWWKPWLLRIITGWKSIHYFTCGLETPLSTAVLNLARTWIMYKISRGRHHVFMTKPIRFLSRNQQFLSSSLIITIGNQDIEPLKIVNLCRPL